MKQVTRGVAGIILWSAVIILFSAPVAGAEEMFVISADEYGIANYMLNSGDEDNPFYSGDENNPYSSQEDLQLMGDDGLPYSMGDKGYEDYFGCFGLSDGNGIGDFDNDGDLDYIMGHGFWGGNVYFFEKIGSGNQFEEPVAVAGWPSESWPTPPTDMAVADFNNDGNLDFVMSYQNSNNCGLYLGNGGGDNGVLGFTVSQLGNAAPYSSAGADAADFNNDGLADFVIAPWAAGEPFYVNRNDKDNVGAFITSTFEAAKDDKGKSVGYFGVAAADFDGDGNVEIAATAASNGYLDIYKINNEDAFELSVRYEYDLNLSPLDNYDFNGDGIQDLVVANYGSNGGEDVAILLGNFDDDGFFFFENPVIYGGGTGGARYSVSAPPQPTTSPPESNKEPVAVVDPIYLEVTAGEEIDFDGSLSYDEDGQIVSYDWDFGDGTIIDGFTAALSLSQVSGETGEDKPSHIYYEAGEYTVTLKVTDDKDDKGIAQAKIKVLPVAATIQFRPNTLYLKSRDKWVWATVRLPEDFDAREIDDASVCVVFEDGSQIFAYTDYGHGFLAKLRKKFYRQRGSLTVRFDRRNLIPKLQIPSENNLLTVRGNVPSNGGWVEFEGKGTIRTKKRDWREDFFGKYWKRNIKHHSKKGGATCRK